MNEFAFQLLEVFYSGSLQLVVDSTLAWDKLKLHKIRLVKDKINKTI